MRSPIFLVLDHLCVGQVGSFAYDSKKVLGMFQVRKL